MKTRITLLIVSILMVISGYAQSDSATTKADDWQQKTLFSTGNGKMTNGFYGGLTPRYGQINGGGAFLMGAKGAWIINHSLGIGLAGNSLASRQYNTLNLNAVAGYFGGNGGFMIEPILFADKPIHVALPVVIGGGYIGEYVRFGDNFWDNGDYAAFGYVEPGIEIEANIIKWFRVSVGAYYSFRWDVDSYGISADIISPLSIGGALKFGIF